MGSLFILLICSSATAPAQTAQVTFYSSASFGKSLVPLSGSAFYGYVFDGDTEMVNLYFGRFATFNLPAGTHTFSAGLSKKQPPQEADGKLTMELVAGKQYFVSAVYNYTHHVFYIYDSHHAVLTEETCDYAQEKASKTKLISSGRVAKPERNLLDPTQAFPACRP